MFAKASKRPALLLLLLAAIAGAVAAGISGAGAGSSRVPVEVEPVPDLPGYVVSIRTGVGVGGAMQQGDVRCCRVFDSTTTMVFVPAVTREIDDGMPALRFADSQRAWVLTGFAMAAAPAVPATEGRDSDGR